MLAISIGLALFRLSLYVTNGIKQSWLRDLFTTGKILIPYNLSREVYLKYSELCKQTLFF